MSMAASSFESRLDAHDRQAVDFLIRRILSNTEQRHRTAVAQGLLTTISGCFNQFHISLGSPLVLPEVDDAAEFHAKAPVMTSHTPCEPTVSSNNDTPDLDGAAAGAVENQNQGSTSGEPAQRTRCFPPAAGKRPSPLPKRRTLAIEESHSISRPDAQCSKRRKTITHLDSESTISRSSNASQALQTRGANEVGSKAMQCTRGKDSNINTGHTTDNGDNKDEPIDAKSEISWIESIKDLSSDTDSHDGNECVDHNHGKEADNWNAVKAENEEDTKAWICDTDVFMDDETAHRYRRVIPSVARRETFEHILSDARNRAIEEDVKLVAGFFNRTAKDLLLLFARVFGNEGVTNLESFLITLRGHTAMPGAPSDESDLTNEHDQASPSALDAMITVYQRQVQAGTRIQLDHCNRSMNLAEFSRHFDKLKAALEQAIALRTAEEHAIVQEIREKIKTLGWKYKGPQQKTIVTDFILHTVYNIDPHKDRTSAAKVIRRRLQADLSYGRLNNRLEQIFGPGIFTLLPRRTIMFPGCSQEEVSVVAKAFARHLPWARDVCTIINDRFLAPLRAGHSGRDLVAPTRLLDGIESLKELCDKPKSDEEDE